MSSNATESNRQATPVQKSTQKFNREFLIAVQLTILILLFAIVTKFFVIVNAGERGVVMQFGKVQTTLLDEGLHFIVPIVNTVQKLSVQVQKQEISAEASSKDLQDVFTDVALNWHLIPEQVNVIYQRIGDEKKVIDCIIKPAIEEILKAVMAKYTAEEIITKREEVKAGVDVSITQRLATYHIAVDDISLVHVHFSERFSEAVEAKQIAEQEAKRAEFIALKAIEQAKARVNLAKGEAEAQRLIRETLTPEILQKETIAKWNGKLPLIVGEGKGTKLFDMRGFLQGGNN